MTGPAAAARPGAAPPRAPADCLFCRIVAGTLPAAIVAESPGALAFLDLHPIRPGHTLVIPRTHRVWFDDLAPDEAAAVMGLAGRVARGLRAMAGVERVALFFTGIHVPHAHAHVVPMHHVHDVTSAAYMADGPEGYTVPPRLDPAEMAATAARLRAAIG